MKWIVLTIIAAAAIWLSICLFSQNRRWDSQSNKNAQPVTDSEKMKRAVQEAHDQATNEAYEFEMRERAKNQ